MKKLNKLFAILVAMAMVLSLGVVSAFAANPVATSTEAGEGVPTKITKSYNKATGVDNPTVQTFNFTAAPQTVDGYETFGSDVTATAANLTVADLFDSTTFTKVGKYRFWVTEDVPTTADGYTSVAGRVGTKTVASDDANFTTTETTEYSQAKYQVDLVIASYTNPTTLETEYYVQSAAVKRLVDDEGKQDGTKPDGDASTDGTGINLDFTNKVNKEIVRDPEDETPTTKDEDKQALEISKTVTNKNAEKEANPAQEFNFKATVAFPTNTKAASYTTVIKEIVDGTVTEVGAGPTFTASALTKTFTLKAGQWLAFTDIEAGATVTVTEDTIPGFTASGLETNYVVKDTGNNAIDVTNKWDESEGSVTGILMSNIPYIVLALVAIGGLCAYVVVRRRQSDEA